MSSEEECSGGDFASEVNSVYTEAYMVNQHRSKQVPAVKKLVSGRSRREGMSLYVKRNSVRNITSRVEASILRRLTTVPTKAHETLMPVREDETGVDDIKKLVTNTPDRSKSVKSRLTKARRTGNMRGASHIGVPSGTRSLSS